MKMLIWFGLFIGVLVAVSEAAGTTVTLFGLLFALIGGSLVTWFRGVAPAGSGATTDTRLSESQVKAVAEGAGYIALGGFLGLLLGFGLRTVDLLLIRPNVPLTKHEKTLEDATNKLAALEAKLSTQPGEPKMTELLVELRRELARLRELPAEVRQQRGAVSTQKASYSELRALAEKLAKAKEAGSPNPEALSGLSKALYGLADDQALADKHLSFLGADRSKLPNDVRDSLDKIFPTNTGKR